MADYIQIGALVEKESGLSAYGDISILMSFGQLLGDFCIAFERLLDDCWTTFRRLLDNV